MAATRKTTKTIKRKSVTKGKLKTRLKATKVVTWAMAIRTLKSHGFTGIKF